MAQYEDDALPVRCSICSWKTSFSRWHTFQSASITNWGYWFQERSGSFRLFCEGSYPCEAALPAMDKTQLKIGHGLRSALETMCKTVAVHTRFVRRPQTFLRASPAAHRRRWLAAVCDPCCHPGLIQRGDSASSTWRPPWHHEETKASKRLRLVADSRNRSKSYS